MKNAEKEIPRPSIKQVEKYLRDWDKADDMQNYYLQEKALDKLFKDFCPENKDLSEILLKVATLNDFYSTNIYSVNSVAKHILSLNIDKRLNKADMTLVSDLQKVTVKEGVVKNFYSFATKYCSHHSPLEYPIYDIYVEKVLCYFRDHHEFFTFKKKDLKNYEMFKKVIVEFRKYYRLEKFDLKEIDKYLWQLGKKYFPKDYSKKSKNE